MKRTKVALWALAVACVCAAPLIMSCSSGDAAQSSSDDSYKLVTPGELTVAASLDFPPFENLNGSKVEGYEVDLMHAIAKKMGLTCTYLPTMKFDSIIPAIVAGGTADVGVSGFTITPDREEEVDFSQPICDTNQCLVTMKNSDITDISQLSGARIGAETGTTGLSWAKENIRDAKEVVAFDEYPAVFAALQSGQVSAVVVDKPVADYYIKVAYPDCKVVKEIPTGEQYGIAVNKNNPKLTAAINKAIDELKADGTFQQIQTTWFG